MYAYSSFIILTLFLSPLYCFQIQGLGGKLNNLEDEQIVSEAENKIGQ